jgi:hypothetical protein
MLKILTAAALAALVVSPALAKTHHGSLSRSRAEMQAPFPPANAYDAVGPYGDGYYGGAAARGSAGLPLGDGTANSPGGIIGGGPGAWE